MSVALRGDLKDFGIAEVFQLIGQQRKTGTLEIEHAGETIRLQLAHGAVVRAEPVHPREDGALIDRLVRCGLLTRERVSELEAERSATLQSLRTLLRLDPGVDSAQVEMIEDLLTRDTLFRLLRWSDGSFHFDAGDFEVDREPGRLLAAEQVLMDGLRMVDEWRTFADSVPSEDTVFQRSGQFDSYARQAGGEARRRVEDAKRIFLLVDGRLSARRIIDLARVDTFAGTRLLADLRAAGLIEPLDPAQVRIPEPRRVRPRIAAPPRAWVPGALPLLLLALLALALHLPRDVVHSDGPARFPIARAPYAAARIAFETERMRRALDAYRFETGRWPEQLDALVAAGFLDRHALASAGQHPYYYVRREDAVLLLAPRH